VAIPSLCVRIDLRKEEDHFLTVFFFFGRGAIGDWEYRKGKAQLIHVANVFRTATKNKKTTCWRNTIRKLSLKLRCCKSCYNCKKKHNVMAGNIGKLLIELMLRKFRLPKIKNCLLEEYNQNALLGVSLFCFGSDAFV